MDALLAEPRTAPRVPNGVLGTIFFILAEVMFFLGLVFVTLSTRRDSVAWPPPGSPPLDLGLLFGNTLVLMCSGCTMVLAARAVAADRRTGLFTWLGVTTGLGAVFLVGQMAEFARLGGWRPAEGIYRTLFDILAGFHGLHVAVGLVLLTAMLFQARGGQITAAQHIPFTATALYWYFVTVIWLVLLAALISL